MGVDYTPTIMAGMTTLSLVLLTSTSLVFGLNDYALIPDSDGTGVLASPNFPFSHSWPHYSYTLFAGQPGNVCFKFYRFLFAEKEDQLTVSTYTFHDKGSNVNNDSDIRTVWQERLCFPVDQSSTLKIELEMASQRYHQIQDEPYGFYAKYTVGNLDIASGSPSLVACAWSDQYRCFSETMDCVNKDDVCGSTPLCPDGSDLTFAHARCEDADQDWDMEHPERSMRMLYRHIDSSNWLFTRKTYGYPINLFSDHTNLYLKEALGAYLRVDPDAHEATLHIDAPASLQGKTLCFQFWYFMRGLGADYLMITAQFGSDTEQTVVWSRQGGLDNEWVQGQVEFGADSNLRMVSFLAGQDNSSRDTLIGLDDISWSEGACPVGDDISTTFGNWSGQKWDYESNSGEYSVIGRTMTHKGKGLIIPAPGSNKHFLFHSPLSSKLKEPMCFSFWYNTNESVQNFVINTTDLSGEKVTHVITDLRTNGNYWRRYRANLPGQSTPFKVVVDVTSEEGSVYVSQPQIIYHACEYLETCLSSEYHCADKGCIPSSLYCDAKRDCDDGSDEWYSSGCKLEFTKRLTIALPIALIALAAIFIGAFLVKRVIVVKTKAKAKAKAKTDPELPLSSVTTKPLPEPTMTWM